MAVLTATDNELGVITLNRPEVKNVVNRDVAQGVEAALDAFEQDGVIRAVIVTGAGDAFCGGADLKAFDDPTGIATERGSFGGIVRRAYTKPLIAAVNGAARGGGFEIVLACHLAVATGEATFGLPEVKRGVIAAAGGLFRLGQRLPTAVANEICLTGDPITAQRALELGLINEVVDGPDLMIAAKALARRVTANGPLAVRLSQDLVAEAPYVTEDVAFAHAADAGREVMQSEDLQEGIRAFFEKRKPNWTGR